jgi:3-dehydroquinate synthase
LSSKSEGDRVYRQRFSVPFEYAVCFTHGVFAPDNRVFVEAVTGREPGRRHRLMVVIDAGVAAAWPALAQDVQRYCERHPERLQLAAPPRVIPGGEEAKQSPALIEDLLADMHRAGLDRHAFVVAVGGGAVLDAVGYAAATCHRGVRLVRVPTTVLGQNDSGVGVKNGVNAFGAKNYLGTFAPPHAVINDADFLRTLDPRDLRAGIAEAVKVALIRDRAFFEWLEGHREALRGFEPAAMATMIRRSAEIHMDHIARGGDPFELGSSRPLDFGHWVAHKLESLSGHRIRHGEAVAIGMAVDTHYSVRSGLLPPTGLERVCDLLEGIGFSLYAEELMARGDDGRALLLDGLAEFREHLGGELTVTLLEDIGRGVDAHAIDAEGVSEALSWLRAREQARDAAQ